MARKQDDEEIIDEPDVIDASGGFLSSISDIDGPAVDDLEDEEEDIDALNQGQYLDDASDDSVRLYLREIG